MTPSPSFSGFRGSAKNADAALGIGLTAVGASLRQNASNGGANFVVIEGSHLDLLDISKFSITDSSYFTLALQTYAGSQFLTITSKSGGISGSYTVSYNGSPIFVMNLV